MGFLRGCVMTALSLLIVGCAGYKEPKDYRYFPEYGYLPVTGEYIEIPYVAYDWYNHDPKSGDKHLPHSGALDFGDLVLLPRESLPQTKEEAQSLVKKNLNPINQRRQSEMMSSIPSTLVLAPLAMLYWAPVIGGVIQQSAPPTSGQSPIAKPKPPTEHGVQQGKTSHTNDTKYPEPMKQTEVRVTGTSGEMVPDAAIMFLLSPTAFEAYADTNGHRTFPNRTRYWFYLSDPLSTSLSEYLDTPDAPKAYTTNSSGLLTHILPLHDLPNHTEDASILILVKKPGYRATTIRVSLSKFLSENKINVVLEKENSSTPNPGLNPWEVARKLKQQVGYYTFKYKYAQSVKYNPSLLEERPSIPWAEFEKLLLEATMVAPDYPMVQAGRFYYELEKGQPSEAKKYHRFIEDEIYVERIYGMRWSTGPRVQ